MTHWQEADVQTNGIRLHYTRTGGNGPPLVLAHGVTDSGLCWSPLAAALAPAYDVIMIDARGHGLSEAPAQGYDSATMAADLAGLIEALSLRRPAILGHSMGAAATLALAGSFPDLPGAILLEDPPSRWMAASTAISAADASRVIYGRQEEAARLSGMRAWFDGLKQKTREQLLAEQRAATPGWSEAELEPWADAKLQVSAQVARIFDPAAAQALDWQATVRRINCPALLITADRSRGAAVGPEAADALRALIPQLQIAHLPGAGHNIRREQFGPYLKTVRAFLATHYRQGQAD